MQGKDICGGDLLNKKDKKKKTSTTKNSGVIHDDQSDSSCHFSLQHVANEAAT